MNKKVLGAESIIIDDKQFRSRLEGNLYKNVFKPSGLDIRYETLKINLLESFYPNIFYIGMVEHSEKQRAITYTPDFVYYDPNGILKAIIEIKGGYVTDRYPLKKKMVLKYLSTLSPSPVFFEVHNTREALFCVDKLKDL